MKIGLYSITYGGVWYQGKGLPVKEMMRLSAGIEYVHEQTRLAMEYLQTLRAEARSRVAVGHG